MHHHLCQFTHVLTHLKVGPFRIDSFYHGEFSTSLGIARCNVRNSSESPCLQRGMTLASRVEVFTELSCRQLHDSYNHTAIASNGQGLYISVHHSLDPLAAGPNLTPLYFHSQSPPQSLKESEGDDVSKGDGPRVIPGKKCVSDPAVQAGAARLQAIMTTTMGALSALTTGWWGHFGERYGRTRILAISTLGLFITYVVVHFRGEEWAGLTYLTNQRPNLLPCLYTPQPTRCLFTQAPDSRPNRRGFIGRVVITFRS
jgi:hypothetical protein